MKKTIIILLFWIFSPVLMLHAQEYLNKDSLLHVLKAAPDDTSKVKLLISTGQQYEGNIPDSALWYYNQALKLSKELNYTRGVISYYTNVTYVYNLLGKYDTALVLNLQALEIARAYGKPERIIACTNNVAASYYYLEDFVAAADYYLQTAELLKKNRDELKLCQLYTNLANVYLDTREYKKSTFYADSAIYLSTKLNNVYGLLLAINTKSLVLTNTHKYTEAIALLDDGITKAKKINDHYFLGTFLVNLADIYLKTGNSEKAEKLYRESLQIAQSIGEKKGISIGNRGLGYYFMNKKDFGQAEYYAKKALALSLSNNFQSEIQKNYLLLSDLALATGRTNEYNRYRLLSDSVDDVILNDKISRDFKNLEIKYQAEQKEREIDNLNHESELQRLEIRKKQLVVLSLLGILFTVALSFVFILRVNSQKRRILQQEKEIQDRRIAELEIEKQLISSEAILKGQEEERMRLARDLHDGLGGMLSGIKFSFSHVKENLIMTPENQNAFDRSLEMLGSSILELRRIAHNMMPESLLKFGLDAALSDFCTDFNNSGTIKVTYQSFDLDKLVTGQTTLITIYRIVQELLNNVRKHASANEAIVQLIYSDQTLSVTVEDDGKGFNPAQLNQADGIGWKNIKSRVEYLNGTWDIQSEPGKGTTVNVEIKMNEQSMQ